MPQIIKLGGDLTKFWQKQVESFFSTPCIFICHADTWSNCRNWTITSTAVTNL